MINKIKNCWDKKDNKNLDKKIDKKSTIPKQ